MNEHSHASIKTPLGPVTLRPAEPDELDAVFDILQDAAAWLVSRGIDQWPSPIPEVERLPLARHIAEGDLYLARLQPVGRAVGTLYFRWIDPELWHDEKGEAGYVHSLAIHRSVRGFGMGAAILEWAKAHIRERGKKYLRLDCVADNPALNRYYQERGLVLIGQVQYENYAASLYQVEV